MGRTDGPKRWLLHAAPMLAGWGIYWLAFFPGVVSHDAVNQWEQIQSGRYDDMQPAFHTFVIWLITRPWRSLAAASATHVVLTAVLSGHLLSVARGHGVSPVVVWCVTAWLLLSPVFGMHAIAVGRDTSFGIAVLWTTALLLRVAERETVTVSDGVRLGIGLALLSLLRHNGAAVAALILIFLAGRYVSVARRSVIAALIIAVMSVAIIRGPLYRLAHVRAMTPVADQPFVFHQVAALIAAGTPLGSADKEFLEAIIPLPVWRERYRCWNSYPLLFGSGLNLEPVVGAPLRLPSIWAHLVAENPRGFLRHWRCITRFVRSPDSALLFGPFFAGGSPVAPNVLGLKATPWLPSAELILRRLIVRTSVRESAVRTLVWQPATSLYLLLASLAVAVWRSHSAGPVLVWLPGLGNSLVWLLGIAPAASVRYQWPVILLAPLLVALAAGDWPRARLALAPARKSI